MSMGRNQQRAVQVAKALADPTRYELLRRIAAAGEINCRDLTTLFPLAQATVSHHLKVLCGAGLVKARPQAQFHYFSVHAGALSGHAATLVRSFSGAGSGKARKSRSPRRGQP